MTASTFYALFDTILGECAIAWTARGVSAVCFPEQTKDATLARLVARVGPEAEPARPPAGVALAIRTIIELLQSGHGDLASIALDLDHATSFERQVYEVARAIPAGSVMTYGDVAKAIGNPKSVRAIGGALGRNPVPLLVPCHRVVAAGGRPGGFSAPGGLRTKQRVLAAEGVSLALPDEARVAAFDSEDACRHLRDVDPLLGKYIDDVGAFTMKQDATSSTFRALAESIVYQQLTGKAAATIFGRVEKVCGKLTPKRLQEVSDKELREAGLSNAKTLALRDLAVRATARKIPTLSKLRSMDDASIIDCLTEVRGIGQWTVEMLLMFRLGRTDVLPTGDYGVRNGYSIVYGTKELPTPKELAAHGERWRPYRTVASWYLWRAVDLSKKAERSGRG